MKNQPNDEKASPPKGLALPCMPLNPKWIEEHPCFLSNDPALVRASFNMLFAAWRNAPDASIPSSYASLTYITGLSEVSLGVAFQDLVHGWELREGRLVHVEMHELCAALWVRHGETFAQFAVDAAAVMQAPEEFELTAEAPVSRRTKGRRLLPPNWMPAPNTVTKMIASGFTDEADREKLVAKMRNWANSGAQMKNDWDATLLTFLDREPPPNRLPLVPFTGTRFGGLASKGEIAAKSNLSVMEQARRSSQERQ